MFRGNLWQFANAWQQMQIQSYEKSGVISLGAACSAGSQMICLTSFFILHGFKKVNNDKQSQHWTKCHQTSVQNTTKTKKHDENRFPHYLNYPHVSALQSALFPSKEECNMFFCMKISAEDIEDSSDLKHARL